MLSSIRNLRTNKVSRPRLSRLSWVFTCALAALSLSYVNKLGASASENLPFYLPLHSDQFPQIITKLETALQKAGITDLSVRTADYWQGYQQGLRRGRKGVYFAAPHFAAWSINQHDFEPLLRLNEPLRFVIANKRANSQHFEINDLANQKICTQRPLNLDYLLVNTGFDNPVLSANTLSVWSVIDEINNPKSGCAAFAISDHFFITLEKSRPQEFIRLQQGRRFNNYVFIAHPSLSHARGNKIRTFLLREDIQALLQPIYKLTSTKTKLVSASRQDYPLSYTAPLAPYWQRKK